MKIGALSLFLLLFSFLQKIQSQEADWDFSTFLERDNFYLLHGKIDGKYPITMQLWDRNYACCGDPRLPIQFKNGAIDGWYSYDKIGKRIQLIGYHKNDEYVRLYVPGNLFDTIDYNTCELQDYREVFTNDENFDLTKLKWRRGNESTFKAVELEMEHKATFGTKVFLAFNISEIELLQVNISELTEIFSIDKIEILSSSYTEGCFHVLFELKDWGWREAQYYVGYLRIDEDLNIAGFTLAKTYDSWFGESQDEIIFDIAFPEQGITIIKH